MGDYKRLCEALTLRKVFFSFDFDNDAWRAGQVRNSGITKSLGEVGFVDSVEWEVVRKSSDTAIKAWINEQLKNTSVTVVLVGRFTNASKWVHYEIEQSILRGNALLAVEIHNLKNCYGVSDYQGINPLDSHKIYDRSMGFERLASRIYKTYNWYFDNGYENIGKWVNEAKDIADGLISQSPWYGLSYR